jgi:spectinomycin phosphotransferase
VAGALGAGFTRAGVRALPEGFEASVLVGLLAEGWGFAVEAVEYVAVGGGSYHWLVTNRAGTRGFVTVDDLDRKPWLGDDRDSVFEGLGRAFGTAVALHEAGLGFLVAPIRTGGGESVWRAGPRYTVALFPFLAGRAGRFGHYDSAERAALLMMLTELHRATPIVASLAGRIDLALPGRAPLVAALNARDETWRAGPFSEPARQALAGHASEVAELLGLFDRLAAQVARGRTDWVVTHGEPHAANLLGADGHYLLVDWDTVALAPPERDLWMLTDDTTHESHTYTAATGHQPDQDAINYFSLRWHLADLAAFTHVLRSHHIDNADTAKALDGLTHSLTRWERWATLIA